MNANELDTVFAVMTDLWPGKAHFNDEQRIVWSRALGDAPAKVVVEAVRDHAAKSKWTPWPAEIGAILRAKQAPTAKAAPTKADTWKRRAIGHKLPVEGRPAREIALDVLRSDARWAASVYGSASRTRQYAFREWQRARFKLGHRADELPKSYDAWPEADRAEYEELAPPREAPARRELSEAAL